MHGEISSVSEPEATKALAQHLVNAADLLKGQMTGVLMVDGKTSEVLSGIGSGGAPGPGEPGAVQMPINKPETTAFNAVNPVAGRPFALQWLVTQLEATDTASMTGIAAKWGDTASAISEAMAVVPAAIADLSSSSETEAIQRAMTHLSQVEASGNAYAQNATALGMHTASLVSVAEANQLQAAATNAVVQSTQDPILRKALEQAFLEAFSPKLTVELHPVTPPFSELLPPLGSPSGGSIDTTGPSAAATPAWDNAPLPKVIQQALANNGYRDLAYAAHPGEVISQFGRPNPDVLESIAAGATPTQAAGVNAPSAPPTLTPGSQSLSTPTPTPNTTINTGPGIAAGGVPAGSPGSVTTAPGARGASGISPASAGTGRAGATAFGAGLPGAGGGRGGFGGSGSVGGFGTSGRTGAGATNGLGASGRPGGFSGLGSLGSPRSPGAAGPGFAGSGGAGGFGGGVPVGGAPGAAGALGGTHGGAHGGAHGNHGGAHGGANGSHAHANGMAGNGNASGQGNGQSHGSRGGVVGAPGAYGGNRGNAGNGSAKKGKVQAVTSTVEREGNLKALLGEAPEVVPGVIGSWVRQPRG